MVFIAIEFYKKARVNVTKHNEDYVWIKIKDVQDKIGLKNISDLLIKQMKRHF